jgi:peroxiredoxin
MKRIRDFFAIVSMAALMLWSGYNLFPRGLFQTKALAPEPAPKPETVAASPQPKMGFLPDIRLANMGGEMVKLRACRTSKCLLVVVAPWCPHCHGAAANINDLRDYLKGRGVAARVAVTADSVPAILGFANEFGESTLLDIDRDLHVPGFPCYMVTDKHGAILARNFVNLEGSVDFARAARQLGLP